MMCGLGEKGKNMWKKLFKNNQSSGWMDGWMVGRMELTEETDTGLR